jgi:hypothetical protein
MLRKPHAFLAKVLLGLVAISASRGGIYHDSHISLLKTLLQKLVYIIIMNRFGQVNHFLAVKKGSPADRRGFLEYLMGWKSKA